MRIAIRSIAWVVFVALVAGAGAVGPSGEQNPVRTHPHAAGEPGPIQQIIVKLRSQGTSQQASSRMMRAAEEEVRVANLAARLGVELQGSRRIMTDLHVLQVATGASGEAIEQTLARLRADPEVQYAEPDQRRFIHTVPDDPLYDTVVQAGAGDPYPTQWYEQPPVTGANATPSAVDAQDAWTTTTGSNGIVIADIDTGVRFDHPDLLGAGTSGTGAGAVATGRLLSGYCFISDSFIANGIACPGPDASDPGDFVTSSDLSSSECKSAQVTTPSNSSWHGTRTAGILGALTNNMLGIAGMTWNGWILPLRALGKCGGNDSDIESAMLWAAGIAVDGYPANPYPAKIINMSIGGSGSCPSSYVDVINQLTALGVLVVASAGNDGGPVDAPANCPGVAGIAGLRQAGTKVGFSNLGPGVALSAPAGNCVNASGDCLYSIGTTFNLGTTTPGKNDYTDELDNPNLGTSFSAPIVSGIAALMLSTNGNLTSAQLITRLQQSSRAFPQTSSTTTTVCHVPTGSSDIQDAECICTTDGKTCGAGMANADAAVTAALAPIGAMRIGAVTPGDAVSLDASGSAAACGHSIASYAWHSSSASDPVTSANTKTTSVLAPASGAAPITVTLTVTDEAGRSDTETLMLSSNAATTTAPASAGSAACPAPITVVSITPNGPSVQADVGTLTFTATVGDNADTNVTWQVNGITGGSAGEGMISSSGVYTPPPAQPSPATVTVSAVSVADPSRSGWTQVTVTPPPPKVTVTPTSASVPTSGTQVFAAAVTNSAQTAVTWQVNGLAGGNATTGTISSTGLYSAPASVPSPATVNVTAVLVSDTTRTGSAQVTIMTPAPKSGGGGALDGWTLLAVSVLVTRRARARRAR